MSSPAERVECPIVYSVRRVDRIPWSLVRSWAPLASERVGDRGRCPRLWLGEGRVFTAPVAIGAMASQGVTPTSAVVVLAECADATVVPYLEASRLGRSYEPGPKDASKVRLHGTDLR